MDHILAVATPKVPHRARLHVCHSHLSQLVHP